MLYSKLILCLLFYTNIYAQNLVVIVSKNSEINNITKKELSKIFLAKTKSLPNGKKSIVVEHPNKRNQAIFYKIISNKNEKQLRKYWAKMIFTGRGQPPKKFETIEELIQFVQNNKNAISYIPLKNTNNNLKILMEIK